MHGRSCVPIRRGGLPKPTGARTEPEASARWLPPQSFGCGTYPEGNYSVPFSYQSARTFSPLRVRNCSLTVGEMRNNPKIISEVGHDSSVNLSLSTSEFPFVIWMFLGKHAWYVPDPSLRTPLRAAFAPATVPSRQSLLSPQCPLSNRLCVSTLRQANNKNQVPGLDSSSLHTQLVSLSPSRCIPSRETHRYLQLPP